MPQKPVVELDFLQMSTLFESLTAANPRCDFNLDLLMTPESNPEGWCITML